MHDSLCVGWVFDVICTFVCSSFFDVPLACMLDDRSSSNYDAPSWQGVDTIVHPAGEVCGTEIQFFVF